jgi:hypothetical protein
MLLSLGSHNLVKGKGSVKVKKDTNVALLESEELKEFQESDMEGNAGARK